MKIFGSVQELVSLIFRKGSRQITLAPNQTVSYSADRVVELPPEDSAGILMSATSPATMTNKTFDANGTGNSLSNVEPADFKTEAGDANKALVRDVSGAVTSAKIVDANIDAAAAIADTKLATISTAGKVSNSATTATASNVNSAIVSRDASGNFSAGTVTASLSGNVTGNVTGNVSGTAGNITATSNSTLTSLPSLSLPGSQVSGNISGNAANVTGIVAPANGGTGVANNAAATLTRTGNFDLNITTTAATAVTMPTTGTLATLAGTEVLTNKDHDGGTASNTSRITLPKANKSILDGLTRKQATLVYGADTNKVYADDGSTLKEIGSGSSGINYLSAQYGADALGTVELNVGDTLTSSTRTSPNQWGSSAASALITQSTDSTLRGTTNYLVQYTANAQFVESPLFSIDGEDLGKPLLVQFDVSGVSTADDVQVYVARYNSSNVLQERILVAGTASATSPNSAQVPTSTTTFRGFFIPSSTSTDKYAVRWRRNANNTSMRLDTFFVGPQSLAQGAIVTQWKSFTPSWSGFTSDGVNVKAAYRRVGSVMHIKLEDRSNTTVSTNIQLTIPDGYSIDTSVILASSSDTHGTASAYKTGTGTFYHGLVSLDAGAPTKIVFTTVGGTTRWNATSPFTWAATDRISLDITIPIAQWSSGTTTLADRAVEEYASNDGSGGTAAGATYNTGMVNGLNGSSFPAVASTTAGTRTLYLVRFNTPILDTDKIEIEVYNSTANKWAPITQWTYTNLVVDHHENDSYYGMGWYSAGSTDIYVTFGNKGRGNSTTAGAGFGANGAAWSDIAGSATYKWRVRKVSGGAAVGFPVDVSNIISNFQYKSLSSNFTNTSPSTEITALTFNNLTVGKTYKITFTGYLSTAGGHLWFQWGAGTDSTKYHYIRCVTPDVSYTFTKTFVASQTSCKFYGGGAGSVWRASDGNDTPSSLTGGLPKTTFATLEEISGSETTTKFI